MNLFGRKMRFVLLVSGAAIIMLIIAWRYVQGGAATAQGGFVPVNAQMQELLNSQSEDTGAKADKTAKSGGGSVGSKDTKISTNAQGGKDSKDSNEAKDSIEAKGAKDVKDAKEAKDAKDTKDAKNAKDAKNVKDAKDAKNVKDVNTLGSKDPLGPKSAQDTKQSTKSTQSINGATGTGGANESLDLKIQESQASLEHPTTETTNKLNINTATWEQLEKLPGIGESKAKAIIAYRGEKGYFHKIEDLVQVKGIGDKMLVKLKAYMYASAP